MRVGLAILMLILAISLPASAYAPGSTVTIAAASQPSSPGITSYWTVTTTNASPVASSGSPAGWVVAFVGSLSGPTVTLRVTVPLSASDGSYIITYNLASVSYYYTAGFSVTAPPGGTGNTGGTGGIGTGSTGGAGTTGGGNTGSASPPCTDTSSGKYGLGADGGPNPCDYLAASHVHTDNLGPILKTVLPLLLTMLAVWQGPRIIKWLLQAFSTYAASVREEAHQEREKKEAALERAARKSERQAKDAAAWRSRQQGSAASRSEGAGSSSSLDSGSSSAGEDSWQAPDEREEDRPDEDHYALHSWDEIRSKL